MLGGKEVVLSYLAAGNYVGEMALLSQSTPLGDGARGGHCETILLSAKTFNEVLARNPTLRGGIEERALARAVETRAREGTADPVNLISFLIAAGPRRGARTCC